MDRTHRADRQAAPPRADSPDMESPAVTAADAAAPAAATSPEPHSDAMTLEAMELEFALGAIDVLAEGFDTALAKAAERVGGEVLFNMPAIDTATAQRIGAIAIAGQPQDQVVFVTLCNDGTTLSVAPPTGDNAIFESLGRNYATIMKSLNPRNGPKDEPTSGSGGSDGA